MVSRYERVDKAYSFLKKKLEDSKPFTAAELAKSTGWKDASTAIAKKLSFVITKNKKSYWVRDSLNEISKEEFRDLCSQKNDKVEMVTRKLKILNRTITDKFLDKAIAACLSAIEIYNKPNFDYRNENFAILMVNAWELLLKARILSENGDSIRSIYCFNRDGEIKYKRGTEIPITKSISECMKIIDDIKCRNNLLSLIQIRDSSVHFINEYPNLITELHKISVSCLDNFYIATNEWFGKNSDEYNVTVFPLTLSAKVDPPYIVPDQLTKNLLEYIEKNKSDSEVKAESQYSYALSLRYEKNNADLTFTLSNDDNAQKIKMTPEDIQKYYKWTYKTLVERLKSRYQDFKQDPKFHGLKKRIINDSKYCHNNKLDYKNPKSSKQTFYHPKSVLEYFDQHYTK